MFPPLYPHSWFLFHPYSLFLKILWSAHLACPCAVFSVFLSLLSAKPRGLWMSGWPPLGVPSQTFLST